jgi:phosphinothricin acetyltransferase
MAGGAAGGAPVVREAAEADLAAIEEIYAYHVRHGLGSFEETPPGLGELRARRQAVGAAGLPYLAAELGVRLAGFAYAAPYRHRPAYRHTVEDSVYVAPEFQGQGVGGALLGRLVELCAERGMREMVAVIGDSGNLPSIGLHERYGFRRAGVLENVGFKHGRWLDTVLMQRSLSPGEGPPSGR